MWKSQDERECKRRDHKIKLVEEIRKVYNSLILKLVVLALYYYCGDNVKCISLKKLVPKKATT